MLKLNKKIITNIFTSKNTSYSKPLISKTKKKCIKQIVNNYDISMFPYQSRDGYRDFFRNKVGRIWHPICNVFLAKAFIFNILAAKYDIAAVEMGLFFVQSGLDKMFHNIAIRKSAALVRKLKNIGITKESELSFAVDYYLKKNGGLVYSNLIRKFAPNQIHKVVHGEKPPQIKGLMSWLQSKFTLFSFYNKSQMVKAKKNVVRFAKHIMNTFHCNFKNGNVNKVN